MYMQDYFDATQTFKIYTRVIPLFIFAAKFYLNKMQYLNMDFLERGL